ncbi:hypothetical protein KKD52_10200 [Myxococcota bacterium]|nr:hypothetical protein [Myxococcota bacterium]
MNKHDLQRTMETVCKRLDELNQFKIADWDRRRIEALNQTDLPEAILWTKVAEVEELRRRDLEAISRLYVTCAAEQQFLLVDLGVVPPSDDDDDLDLNTKPAPMGAKE